MDCEQTEVGPSEVAPASDVAFGATVLVVDDELAIANAARRILTRRGFRVLTANGGPEAVRIVETADVDVIITDIAMPGATGIDLLRQIHSFKPDLPVLLLTGFPSVRTAAQAMEYGATRYLTKPIEPEQMVRAVQQAVHLNRLARIKREAAQVVGELAAVDESADLDAALQRALEDLSFAYQPIVRAADSTIVGCEVFMRSNEPSLPDPPAVLCAAKRLGRLEFLGRAIRSSAARGMEHIQAPELLFVNLHPEDLADPDLLDPEAPLSRVAPRVVLEITDRAHVGRLDTLPERTAALRKLGFRIAIDDLGVGYASLTSFAFLEPEFVKIDMSLVREVDKDALRRRVIRSIVDLCREMRITVIAEGVETEAEHEALKGLGCDWLQGYHFGKPGPLAARHSNGT